MGNPNIPAFCTCTNPGPCLALQAFKPGRVVAARVTGARPMDGLAACTLKGSAVEGGTLTFDDIAPGQLMSGTVDGVEDFGVFVKLAAGLKCVFSHLCFPSFAC